MPKKQKISKSVKLQHIISEYIDDSGKDTIDMHKVAEWAIAKGYWNPPQFEPEKLCARELSRAAREEFYIDPQGREVRKKHCYTIIDTDGQHIWLWVDIETAKPDQMHKSLAARRRSALGDVAQLDTDRKSYNDNNKYGGEIDMSFNFDEDLLEMAQPVDYPEDEDDV